MENSTNMISFKLSIQELKGHIFDFRNTDNVENNDRAVQKMVNWLYNKLMVRGNQYQVYNKNWIPKILLLWKSSTRKPHQGPNP